jgi:Fe2+ or Zn2+ uptake regulation protein
LTQVGRRAIQDLCAAAAPLTVQQLHEHIARDQPTDLSTTYRLVNDLVGAGLVKAVQIAGQTVPGYIVHLPGESNDFVACVTCGSLTWLDDLAELRALERRLATQMHFRGLTHELTLRGQCEPCQNGRSTSSPG